MLCRFSVAILVLLTTISSATANDVCNDPDKSHWKRPDEAKQAASALGYAQIKKVIIEDGCYEVVTINADGKIVGVHIDPVTLELRKVEDPR